MMHPLPSNPLAPVTDLPPPLPLRRRLACPRTRTGWGSVGLVILFFAFLTFVIYRGAQPGHDRTTFFSDRLLAFALIGMAAAEIAAGATVLAAPACRERAIIVFLALLPGAFVLYCTSGAWNGG